MPERERESVASITLYDEAHLLSSSLWQVLEAFLLDRRCSQDLVGSAARVDCRWVSDDTYLVLHFKAYRNEKQLDGAFVRVEKHGWIL